MWTPSYTKSKQQSVSRTCLTCQCVQPTVCPLMLLLAFQWERDFRFGQEFEQRKFVEQWELQLGHLWTDIGSTQVAWARDVAQPESHLQIDDATQDRLQGGTSWSSEWSSGMCRNFWEFIIRHAENYGGHRNELFCSRLIFLKKVHHHRHDVLSPWCS